MKIEIKKIGNSDWIAPAARIVARLDLKRGQELRR